MESCGGVPWQVRTLGHSCTGGCICAMVEEDEQDVVDVNPACPASGHTADVRSVAFSPLYGERVVSGSCDGLVMIWDTATGAAVRCFVL